MKNEDDGKDNLNPWSSTSKWIESNGGYVNNSLNFHEPDRNVRVTSPICSGTLLLRIPSQCLVTLPFIERDEKLPSKQLDQIKRPSLFSVVHEIDRKEIYHEKEDLLLALYLACNMSQFRQRQQFSNVNEIHLKPYLSTLPTHSSFDNLPRRWPKDQLEILLTGTSLLQRIQNEKCGLMNDYNLIVNSWKRHIIRANSRGKDNESYVYSDPPSFETFDHMIATVASRVFSRLGGSDIANKNVGCNQNEFDAMVPLLDLFNHKRGEVEKSDVRYVRSETDGSVTVTASRKLEIDSLPSITYGAKGNSQLLLRYGFCLEANIEPDGSSNDVLEFRPSPGHPLVELRIGPKSYSYPGLVKGLEIFHKLSSGQTQSLDNKSFADEESGVEAFLNSCEIEDDLDFDVYGLDNEEGNFIDDNNMPLDEAIPEEECRALEDFLSALQKLESNYSLCGEELESYLRSKACLRRYYSALLVNSELQTIHFYAQATRSIIARLLKLKNPKHEQKEGGLMLKNALVDDLVTAFTQIRYPNLITTN